MKLIMYGAPICSGCITAKEALLKANQVELDYRDITASVANLRAFLKYRDTEPMFDEMREAGRIGIPFFLLEDGTATFDYKSYVDETAEEVQQPVNACSLDGKGKC